MIRAKRATETIKIAAAAHGSQGEVDEDRCLDCRVVPASASGAG
jgi:hypothetical protein